MAAAAAAGPDRFGAAAGAAAGLAGALATEAGLAVTGFVAAAGIAFAAAGAGAILTGAVFVATGVAGAAVALEEAAEGFAALAAYQVCTPLCPRQAPSLLAAVEYVPSLQIPFDPAGAPAGA